MSDEIIVHGGGPLTHLMPSDGKGLLALAQQVASAGMFKNGRNDLTAPQAFVIMVKGAELGLSPMQSLEHISIIKGKPFVGAAVITARIRQSPHLEKWDVDSDAKHCTITFQRRGDEPKSLTTTVEDIPKRYFQPSQNGEPSNWTLIPEDMLFGWTVRRVARRHFPDALLDLGDAVRDEPAHIIDVAAVEREVGTEGSTGNCEKCGEPAFLHASRNGGAYSQCKNGHRQSPPQEVRDTIRGRTEDFFEDEAAMETPASEAQATPSPLEPGERPVTAAEALGFSDDKAARVDRVIERLKESKDELRARFKAVLHDKGWDGERKVGEWLLEQSHDDVIFISGAFSDAEMKVVTA